MRFCGQKLESSVESIATYDLGSEIWEVRAHKTQAFSNANGILRPLLRFDASE